MTDYDAVGFVISSGYRQEVLEELSNGPATPKRITEECEPEIAHVSRALQELRGKGMVELLVDEERTKGRIYGITEKGSETIESARQMNEGQS